MKYIFYPLIIAAALVSVWVAVMVSISKVYFKFDLGGISIANLTASLASGIPKIDVNVKASIQNENPFKINFSDLFIQLFYNTQLIAASKQVNINKYTVQPKSVFQFQEPIEVFVNTASIAVIKDVVAKKPVLIEYHVRVKIYGVRIPVIVDSFTYPI